MEDIDTLSAEEVALYDMSDEDLEAAFRNARSEENVSTEDNDVVDTEHPVNEDSDELDQGNDEVVEKVVEDSEEPGQDTTDTSNTPDNITDEKPTTYKYKAHGQEFEFTEEEIKNQFGKIFGQAMDYTKKMQELKPWRTQISALKDNNISHDDINLMIDVLKGDKDAVTSLLKRTGIDPLELDVDTSKYTPKDYGRSDRELDIEDILSSINKDAEYKITEHVLTSQWDDASRRQFVDNPSYITGLHNDIKNGVFDIVSPMMMKLKVLDGAKKSDIEYYIEAGGKYYESVKAAEAEKASKQAQIQKVVTKQQTQATIKQEASKRKAAAPTNKAAGKRDVVDYLDDSDEAYDEWYKKLQHRM